MTMKDNNNENFNENKEYEAPTITNGLLQVEAF